MRSSASALPLDPVTHLGARLDGRWVADAKYVTLTDGVVSALADSRNLYSSGRALTQATAVKRPGWASSIAAFGGRPAITDGGSGSGHSKLLTCSDSSALLANQFFRYCVHAPTSDITADCRVFGNGYDSNRYAECVIRYSSSDIALYEGSGSTVNSLSTIDRTARLARLTVTNPGVAGDVSSSGWSLRADGKFGYVSGMQSVTAQDAGTIGVLGFGYGPGHGYPGAIGEFGQGSGQLTPSDRWALIDYAARRYGLTRPRNTVLFDGNSLMVRAISAMATAANARELISHHRNVAVTSRPITSVIANLNASTGVQTTFISWSDSWYVGCEGTNTLFAYTDLSSQALINAAIAQVQSDYQAWFSAVFALGFSKLVICTIPPSTGITAANGREYVRQAINEWLINNKTSLGITKLVNLHTTLPVDGQTCPEALLNPTNTTYFSDGTHYTYDYGVPLYVEQFMAHLP